MSASEPGYYTEGLQEIHQKLDEQIVEAEQQIQRWNKYQEGLSDIDDAVAHFDSVACGTLEVKENEAKIAATISAPRIGERLRQLHREHDWDSIEFDHLEDPGLFQVEMTMDIEKLTSPEESNTAFSWIERIKEVVEEGLRATNMAENEAAESALKELVDISREMKQVSDSSIPHQAAEDLGETAQTLLQQLESGNSEQVEEGLRYIDRLDFLMSENHV